MDLAATSLLITISFCAILIDINDIYGDYGINYDNITLLPIILFCLQWTPILLILHHLSGLDFSPHLPVKNKTLYLVAIMVILSSFIVLLNSISAIKDALIMDLADVRNEHYKELSQGGDSAANYLMLIPQILTNTPFPTLALFLWFYMKAFMRVPFLIRTGILIASILQAITAITMSGRAAMIYWAFDFFMIYSFFYKYLSSRVKLTINATSSILGSLAATLFISITIARFDTGAYSPLASLYGYAGQHVNNFCTMIEKGGDTPLLLDRVFPLFSKITGNPYDMVEHYEKLTSFTNATVNVFDTFGGELYLDLGWFGFIFFILLLSFVYVYLKSGLKRLEFHHIFLLVILIAFFTHGIFAWPFTYHNTTYAIILMTLCFYLFKYEFRL